ncbi:MAG: Spy/CpxP family protein refolding chaperone, partial [Pyrinomonadaceae bacterium]
IALAAPVALAQSGKTEAGDQTTTGQERGVRPGFGQRHGGERRGGRGPGFGGKHGGMMFRGLNLTEDQKAQMKQIQESFRQRVAPLREQMKNQRGEGRGFAKAGTFNEAEATQRMIAAAPLRAKLMGESFKMRQEMLNVLTPEQKTQMEQQRAERKARQGEMGGRRGNRGNRANGADAPQKQ